MDLHEWAAYRDRMNPQVVFASRIEKMPLSYDYISLVARFDTKAAADVASCGVDTIERRCARCGGAYLQRLSSVGTLQVVLYLQDGEWFKFPETSSGIGAVFNFLSS